MPCTIPHLKKCKVDCRNEDDKERKKKHCETRNKAEKQVSGKCPRKSRTKYIQITRRELMDKPRIEKHL
jgi:hypothetical protein